MKTKEQQDNITNKVFDYIRPYILDRSFTIPSEVVEKISEDFCLEQPYKEALARIFRWFNDHHLYNNPNGQHAKDFVTSSSLDMAVLVVQRDLWSLIDQWIVADMDDYMCDHF